MRYKLEKYALLLSILAFAFNTKGQDSKTFYVCSGTGFTLAASDTTFQGYDWDLVGGGANPIATTSSASLTAPTVSGTTYSTVQYTLSVLDSGGCWSDEDTFTIHVLPGIVATIAGNNGAYCTQNSISDTLTASVGTLTLPTGVAADQYAWTAGGSPTGTNSNTLAITSGTSAGSTIYAVTVTYSLPAGIGGSKLSDCSGTDNTTIVVGTPPTTPSISIQ